MVTLGETILRLLNAQLCDMLDMARSMNQTSPSPRKSRGDKE